MKRHTVKSLGALGGGNPGSFLATREPSTHALSPQFATHKCLPWVTARHAVDPELTATKRSSSSSRIAWSCTQEREFARLRVTQEDEMITASANASLMTCRIFDGNCRSSWDTKFRRSASTSCFEANSLTTCGELNHSQKGCELKRKKTPNLSIQAQTIENSACKPVKVFCNGTRMQWSDSKGAVLIHAVYNTFLVN